MSGTFSSHCSAFLSLALLAGAEALSSAARGEETKANRFARSWACATTIRAQFNPLEIHRERRRGTGQAALRQGRLRQVRLLTTTRGKKRKADAPTLANIRAAIKALLAKKTRARHGPGRPAGHGMQQKVQAESSRRGELLLSRRCAAQRQRRRC